MPEPSQKVTVEPNAEFDTAIQQSEGTEGHRLKLSFDDGLRVELIHPEGGCQPPSQCFFCAADLRDPDAKRCYDCKNMDPDAEGCWLTGWVDEQGYELVRGSVTLPVAVAWETDYPLFHLLAALDRARPASRARLALQAEGRCGGSGKVRWMFSDSGPKVPCPNCKPDQPEGGEADVRDALAALVSAIETAEQLATGGEAQEANVNAVLTAAVSRARAALKSGGGD
jgi:hypothetical protein